MTPTGLILAVFGTHLRATLGDQIVGHAPARGDVSEQSAQPFGCLLASLHFGVGWFVGVNHAHAASFVATGQEDGLFRRAVFFSATPRLSASR